MKRLLAALAISMMVGCDVKEGPSTVTNVSFSVVIRTAEHDGHRFITANTGSMEGGMSIIHHPACACLKIPVEQSK